MTPLQHLVAGIALLAGDEEDFLGRELGIPVIVGVAHVLHDDGAFGQAEAAGSLDFVLPSRGDGHKGRQIAVMIQEGMKFDAALGAPEASPGKQGQAEAHYRVASRLKSLFLNRNLCFGASGWQRRYIRANRASKKEAGR